MAKYFVFSFKDIEISAKARLNEKDAPQTCEILWQLSPFAGDCRHGIYSGTTTALLIDPKIEIPPENQSVMIQKGDLMFTHYNPFMRHGHSEAVSEIYWAYDRYCSPRMPGSLLPTVPNIFGEFLPDSDEFFEMCRSIRLEGVKQIIIKKETD